MDNLKPLGLGVFVLIFALTVIFRIVDIKGVMEPPYLTFVLNTIFVFIPSLIIAVITVRGFQKTGAWAVLWLGIGSITFGTGAILSGLLITVSTGNIAVTVGNLIFFISASLHFAGGFFVLSNVPDHKDDYPGRPAVILVVYTGVIVLVTAASLLGVREILPPFFVEGSGGTPLRQVLLTISTMLFLYSSIIFFIRYFRTKSPLIYWYAFGLLLLSLSMAGLLMPTTLSTPMNWIGRIGQYFSGLYLLAAALVAMREAKFKRISTEKSLANLLSITEKKLHEVEQKYTELVMAAPSGIFEIDFPQKKIISVNDAMCEMTGYKREELLAMSPFNLFNEEGREHFNNRISAWLKGELPERDMEYGIRTKEGRIVPALLDVKFTTDEAGKPGGALVITHDITERKEIEEALRNSELQYRMIADNTYAFEFWLDPQGNYIYASPSSDKICGIKNTEFLTDPSLRRRMVHPDDLAAFDRHVLEERNQIAGETEIRVCCRDGSYRWVAHVCQPIYDENGKFLGTRGSNRDITARKKVEEVLIGSEQQLRSLAENVPSVLMRYDRDLRVVYLSKKFDEYSTVPAGQFIGKTDREAGMPEGLCSLFEEAIRKVFETGENRSLDYDYLAKDGTNRTFSLTLAPEFGKDGKVNYVLGVSTDITERKKAERIKDEFIGMVSHELKTPLTVTMGALYTVRKEGLSEDEIRGLLQDAVSGAESLANIVENLLELSRFQADRLELHPKYTDIGKIAGDVAHKMRKKSDIHHINLDIPEGMETIKVDPLRLERILFNLVENAIKYSPKGGEVRITVRREKNELVVCVSDQGPGISPENQRKLFRSFEQLDIKDRHSIQGVGLGLKVCRTLVEAHGGRIWVESEPGRGANFCFTLLINDGER